MKVLLFSFPFYHSLSYLYAVIDALLLSAYMCVTPLVDAIIARVGSILDIAENLIIELKLFVALVLFLLFEFTYWLWLLSLDKQM